MALWLLWLQNGREEKQFNINSRWICKLDAEISTGQTRNVIFVVLNELICSNTLTSANSALSFSNFHSSKQFNSLIYSYLYVWKGESMESVSFKDEGEGFASEEKSIPVYQNFCHL